MRGRPDYPAEPADKRAFTRRNDRAYGRFARLYNSAVKAMPFWQRWIQRPLADIAGPRVLELSFGTGYLLTRYARDYETWAVDYNWGMARVARQNLAAAAGQSRVLPARLLLSDVAALPFPDHYFDTVLCTMAFSAYPDGRAAMAEISRVLRSGGRLLLVDVNFPADDNRLGRWAARVWIALGDILRDMAPLFDAYGFSAVDQEIGASGSVHYYLARKGPAAGP